MEGKGMRRPKRSWRYIPGEKEDRGGRDAKFGYKKGKGNRIRAKLFIIGDLIAVMMLIPCIPPCIPPCTSSPSQAKGGSERETPGTPAGGTQPRVYRKKIFEFVVLISIAKNI